MSQRGSMVGIDIGGTFVKCGLIVGSRVTMEQRIPTARSSTPRSLQDGIVEAVRSFTHRVDKRIEGVGIGIPGLVRYPEGVVRSCVNLTGWRDVPLKRLLKRRLGLPVEVDNDVHVMTLAEWTYGAGRGASNLVCLTLGTGVGGGLVLDGRLIRGWTGSAGEVGHFPVQENGPRCPCGGIACLERYVGNQEVIQWVKAELARGVRSQIPQLVGGQLKRLTPEVIDQACRLGDPLARQTWIRVGHRIGLTLAGVVNLLNPERIVIGGGIAKAGKWLFEPLKATVRRRAMRGLRQVSIVPANLGVSAGIIGAALLVREG